MKKLASYNFDIIDHVMSGDLEKVASVLEGLSEDVKNSTLPDFNEQQDRDRSDFALVTYHPEQGYVNKYAHYTKELTEVSAAFLASKRDELPDEILKTASTNLNRACKKWGIPLPEELSSYSEKSAQFVDPVINLNDVDSLAYTLKLEKNAEEDAYFALPSQEKYPISTPEQITQAQEYFDKYANDLSVSEALEYAVSVKKACKQTGVDLKSEKINKIANLDFSTFNPNFQSHLGVRKRYLLDSDTEKRAMYDELEKLATNYEPSKVAQVLEQIDLETGNDQLWGRKISNPLLAVGMPKEAQERPTLEELQALDSADLMDIVGNDTISALKGEEGVDVYKTLPRPMKKEIDFLLGL